MRRRAGLGAIQEQQMATGKYKDKGDILKDCQLTQMTKQMDTFREKLEEFAVKHKNDIRKNSQFRRQFQQMCVAIGVDPLSSGKGFWSILGMSDFYYELSVQVAEVCLACNQSTGGLMDLVEVRRRLIASRGQKIIHQEITIDDILIATRKLGALGNGDPLSGFLAAFREDSKEIRQLREGKEIRREPFAFQTGVFRFTIYPVGNGRHIVQSVPGELSRAESSILSVAFNSDQGYVTRKMLENILGWTSFRSQQAIDKIIAERLVWVDFPDKPDSPIYWFPSLFSGRKEA